MPREQRPPDPLPDSPRTDALMADYDEMLKLLATCGCPEHLRGRVLLAFVITVIRHPPSPTEAYPVGWWLEQFRVHLSGAMAESGEELPDELKPENAN